MTRNDLIEAIMTNGQVDRTTAEYVIKVYKAHRLLTYNVHDGFGIKHGALLDTETIKRAATRN